MSDRIETNSNRAADNANFYDTFWDLKNHKISGQQKARARFIVASINKYISRRDLRILDLGCGTGWLAKYLSDWGEVTGVDFSQKVINFAQENFGQYAQYFVADPTHKQLGLPEDIRFDLVVSSEVIEHVVDHEAFIQQLETFLKPGGYCAITTPNGRLYRYYASNEYYKQRFQPVENWLTPRQLRGLVRQYRYEILIHHGLIYRKFLPGWFGWFQHQRVEKAFRQVGLTNIYPRLIVPFASYQLMFLRKD